jgi:hypothetical protein
MQQPVVSRLFPKSARPASSASLSAESSTRASHKVRADRERCALTRVAPGDDAPLHHIARCGALASGRSRIKALKITDWKGRL